MRITVADALQMEALKDAVLVAGEKGKNRIIKSINIMEVPDIQRFIKKDELLVTTTYPIRNDKRAQQNLIPTLVHHGVAALAIKPVFYGNVVPQFMIQQADKAGFPIISLPRNASFNEILNPVLGEILNRQARILRRNEEIHQRFTDLVLGGGSLSEIADMLASLQSLPVSIHSTFWHLLAYGAPAGGSAADHDMEAIAQELDADKETLVSQVSGRAGRLNFCLKDRTVEVFVHPVTVAGENYANLIIWLLEPVHYEINVIEQAATIVALETAKLRAVNEVERRFRSTFIEELIQGRIKSRTEVLSRGEQYGWDLSFGFVPLLIEIDEIAGLYHHSIHRPAQLLRSLRNAVYRAISAYAEGSITADIGTRMLIMVKISDNPSIQRKLIRSLADTLLADLRAKDSSLSIGVGRYIEDIMYLGESYFQAIQALKLGKSISGQGSVTFFDDLGAYRILNSEKDNPELELFADEVLGELAGDEKLLETLEVVLQCDGNLKKASQQMYIHYNTLRYRVSRIQEITGLDIFSGEGNMNLKLALMIKRLRRSASDFGFPG